MDNKKLLISMLKSSLKSPEKVKDFSNKLRPMLDLKDDRSIDLMVEDRALYKAMVSWYIWHGDFDKLNNVMILRNKE